MPTTAVITLGHDGTGQWTTEDGSTLPERCDAWIVSISLGQVDHLTTALGHLAKRLGQDAIGLIIHGAQYGPSYVVASA